jgi:hypothetical protein
VQTGSVRNGSINSFALIRYDSGLVERSIWKYYDPSNTSFWANNITHTNDDNYLVQLVLNRSAGHFDAGLMKVDTSGNILWAYEYGDTALGYIDYVNYSFDVSDGYVHFGTSYYSNFHSTSLYKFWMMTSDFNGNTSCTGRPLNFLDSSKANNLSFSSYTLRNDSNITSVTTTAGLFPLTEASECFTTGVTLNLDRQTFHLFPNPSDNYLYVKMETNQESDYLISDLTGRNISDGKFSRQSNYINTSDFSPGTYFIFVNINGNIIPQKFIVNH